MSPSTRSDLLDILPALWNTLRLQRYREQGAAVVGDAAVQVGQCNYVDCFGDLVESRQGFQFDAESIPIDLVLQLLSDVCNQLVGKSGVFLLGFE